MLAKTKRPRQKGITLLLEYNWTLTILVVGPKDLGARPISNNKPKGPAEEENVRG